MFHAPSVAIPLLMFALILGLPGYAQGTTDETGGGAGDYGASQMNVPDSSDQAPPEIAPDRDPGLPAPEAPQENSDPRQEGTPGSPDQPD
jgi:hypothetical protein